jgi:4-amino-4-deoxy-L-arabinose transferase-like glycosyltransferase
LRNSIVVTAVLVAGAIGWLAFEIPRGVLTNTDELFTAERSREMLLLGRSTVHFNFEPSFSKPPLQYWLTSFTLPRLRNSAVAVRIWPLLFGALTAIALARLIFSIEPNRPWLVPIGVAIFVTSPLFLTEACRALLDSGLMFFTTMSILFAHQTRTRPVWWLGVAIAAWLGTLQKIPLIFLIWAIIVIIRISSPAQRAALRNFWLPASFVLALVLICVWPALQFFKFHPAIGAIIGSSELTARIHNVSDRPYLEIPFRMNLAWIGFGTVALLAPVVLLFRKTKNQAISEMSMLCLAVVVFAIIFNLRSVRYLTPIIPCLCALSAFLLQNLFEPSRRIRLVAMGAVVLLAVDVVEVKIKIDSRRKDAANERFIAEQLGTLQQLGMKAKMVGPIGPDGLLWESFYLFYGDLRSPISVSSIDEVRSNPTHGPVAAVSLSRDLPAIRKQVPNLSVVAERGDFTLWRSD